MIRRRRKRERATWDVPCGVTAADVADLYRQHPPTVIAAMRHATKAIREFTQLLGATP